MVLLLSMQNLVGFCQAQLIMPQKMQDRNPVNFSATHILTIEGAVLIQGCRSKK